MRIPARRPLDFDIDANGTVENLVIDRLRAEMPEVLRLEADGYARNLLDLKKLQADVTFDGGLYSPGWPTAFCPGQEWSCRHSPSRAAPECSAMHTTLTSGFSATPGTSPPTAA